MKSYEESWEFAQGQARSTCEGKDREWLLRTQEHYRAYCEGRIVTNAVAAMLEELHRRLEEQP